jgi:hypothetical protein
MKSDSINATTRSILFLIHLGQVILLQQLSPVVGFQDAERSAPSEMKLVEFVKHIQSGVWL